MTILLAHCLLQGRGTVTRYIALDTCIYICQPLWAWEIETGGAYSYGGTAAIWKRPIRHHQPSEPAALRLLEASEAAGSHNNVIV